MKEESRYTLLDYPERGKNSGEYHGKSPGSVATKIFNKISKELGFVDNLGGTKYLVFYIKNIDTGKVYPFIGTIVVLQKPIEINYNNKSVSVSHRNIVSRYDKNMQEVFVSKNNK